MSFPPASTLPPETRDRVRALVDRDGVTTAAKHLGVDRTVVMRVCGGLDVRRGTVALITQSLARSPDRIAAKESIRTT